MASTFCKSAAIFSFISCGSPAGATIACQTGASELVYPTSAKVFTFGSAVVRDRVTLERMHSVCFETEATEAHAGGTLTIRIEEPVPRQMVLRFHYRTTLGDDEGSPAGAYAEYVKSAYHQSDLDTVRVIRMIAESTRFQ